MPTKLTILLAAGLLWPATVVLGADDGVKACQDLTAIQWFTPDDPANFLAARKKAEAEQRILMIKGIAFGIDELGAKCATKGCW